MDDNEKSENQSIPLTQIPLLLRHEKYQNEPIQTTVSKAFEDANFNKGYLTGMALEALEKRISSETDEEFDHKKRLDMLRQVKKELVNTYPSEENKITTALHYYSALQEAKKESVIK